jgi:hypothetical protein
MELQQEPGTQPPSEHIEVTLQNGKKLRLRPEHVVGMTKAEANALADDDFAMYAGRQVLDVVVGNSL